MNDQDYIRAGVELADGWELGGQKREVMPPDFNGVFSYVDDLGQVLTDALAAQLRKQAQSDPHIVFKISVADSASYVEMIIYNPNGDEESEPLRFVANETDEAMAFIKLIVDSKVLETDEKGLKRDD